MRLINLEAMITGVMEHNHGPCSCCLFPYSLHIWEQVEDVEGRFSTRLMCPYQFASSNYWEYRENT